MRPGIRWWRVAAVIVAALALYLLGRLAAGVVVDQFDMHLRGSNEPLLHRAIMTAAFVHAVLMAIPFMPAIEVGMSMLMISGGKLAFLVYVTTVAALLVPYGIGRVVPPALLARAFDLFGLVRARGLVERLAPLSTEQRVALLVSRSPARLVAAMVRHRFIALALVLNLPGNALIGGGGGIGLVAGLSGLYPFPAYLLTVMCAVAPVPAIMFLAG